MKTLRHSLIALILCLLASTSVWAINVTIAGTDFNGYQYGGTTATLKFFASETFRTSTNEIVGAGNPTTGGGFYRSLTCTVSGTVLTCPSITLPSTLDGHPADATWTVRLYDSKGTPRAFFPIPDSFILTNTAGSTTTWDAVFDYNAASPRPPAPGYYDAGQVDSRIAAALLVDDPATTTTLGRVKISATPADAASPIAVGTNDPRLPPTQQVYYYEPFVSLSAAVTAIGSTQATLIIGTPTPASGSLNIPSNVSLVFTGTGVITVATTKTVVIQGPISLDSDPHKIFDLQGTGVVSFTGNRRLGELNGKWWNPTGDGSTDDTALTQAALNAAGTLPASRIVFPSGTFMINGALQGTAGYQGRLLFPYAVSGAAKSIEIIGAQVPYQAFGTVASPYVPSDAGTVFKTTQAGGALFSTGSSSFVGVRPVLRNLTVRREDNPQGALLDCRYCHGFVIEHSYFDTGTYPTSMSEPTNTASYGIRSPVAGNAADSLISHTLIAGFFFGIEMGEHLRMDYVTVVGCARPLYVPTEQNDPITGSYIDSYNNPYTIAADGAAVLSFQTLNIEHVDPADPLPPAWQRPVAGGDVYDPASGLRGLVTYHIIKENLGGTCVALDSEFTVTGAAKLGMDNLCGAPTLITAFTNSWVNVGGGEGSAGYYSKNGQTHLRGNIKSGVLGSPAFQLPARYCPIVTTYFPVFAAADTLGTVSVGAVSGTTCPVTVRTGTNTFISLDGIVFNKQ